MSNKSNSYCLHNNVNYLKLFILLLCALSVSCGFIDLRPIEINIEPEKSDSLLPDAYNPVILKFNTEMEKSETERIMQISSELGTVRGDLFWKNNDLYFVPVTGWTAGIRYTLSLLGTARSVDGREIKLERFVTFYAVNKNEPPFLEWYSPDDGESTGTGDVVLEFHFTRPMDRLSVESAISIDGIPNKTFEWLDDNRVKVIPVTTLNPWTTYRWNLRDSLKSADGVPVAKAYSGRFITDIDQMLPRVMNVYPVLYSDGSWFATGSSIETGLESGQGIAVEFNKPMSENVLRSVRIEPSLSGRAEFLSEKSIVWIFLRSPEAETIYTFTVSSDAKDSEGLKIGSDHKVYFTPDIPFLNVRSFLFVDNSVMENPVAQNFQKVKIDSGTGKLIFSIYFSLPFSYEEKQNTLPKITLRPFFPMSLPSVALCYANWGFDDRLHMRWEGLKDGSDNTPHYYKLTIPGGKAGIKSGMGFYMKEDVIIYLEAVK